MGKDNPLKFEDRTFTMGRYFDELNSNRNARKARIEYSHLTPTFKGTFVDTSNLRIISMEEIKTLICGVSLVARMSSA
eukprot:12900872-Prorocentrum_lima.AAC.1